MSSGNQVVFDSDGSYVENKKTGVKTRIKDEKGEFKMDVWVWTQEADGSGGKLAVVEGGSEPVFNRLEDLI